MLRCMVIGIILGVAIELVARTFRLWIYHQLQTPILNVVVMFGLIMGGVASGARTLGLPLLVVIGFAIGLLYEIANLRILKWWYFPGERLAFVSGHTAIVVVLALLWGLVPAMIAGAQSALPKARPSREARLERLNTREQQLIAKIEALRARQREVETRLEEVRAQKQALLARQAVRRPGIQDASPAPTP